MAYTFNGDRMASVTEYGVEDSAYVTGASSRYSYSAAARRTVVQTTELKDTGETANRIVKTVYVFDDEGDVISEYVYTGETGNEAVEGGGSGIHPHGGESGAGVVSNVNNLLLDHNFESTANWTLTDCNCSDVEMILNTTDALFGSSCLHVNTCIRYVGESGVYQVTNTLPAGDYTFSAYVKVLEDAFSHDDPDNWGVYLKVTDTADNVLTESERLGGDTNSYSRLAAPFHLDSAQSVKVMVAVNSMSKFLIDGAQLESNGYANAYNIP